MKQYFVEHLIELRNYYRVQQLENERRKHHVAQQLTHINALLVDQLESLNLLESLVELRHQYQQQVAECDCQVAHCREQLSHVNALLADHVVEQHEHPTFRATVEEQRSFASELTLSLKEASKLSDDEFSKENKLEKELDEQVPPPADETGNEAAEQEEPETNASSLEVEPVRGFEKQFLPEPTEKSKTQTETLEESSLNALPLEIPLLPQYQHLTKPEALSQLMEEKAGSALHIDWLLRELYGELTEDQTAAEKALLSETLKDGVEQGLWRRIPGAPECFILDLKLADPAKKNTQKQPDRAKSTSTAKSALTVLPKYSGLNLIDAVELIVTDKAGELLTTEQVAKALYGNVSGQELTQGKEIVGRALWKGAEAKRWQNVPQQKGVYTLDMRIIAPTSGSDDTASKGQKADQKPLKVLPAYSRMSFTDAIATVLREHQGEVMTPEQVARELFGDDTSGTRFSAARKRVSRILWGGASKKRWRRLTGAIGRYTLD
ncbi:MAG: hypothetical protein JOZ78_03485 [Chroococcidiopsidaceae cyanobacterium CP_BM_ER_R8_30]|nr:hypothetical protein [Chroococcidiopsidaceae cyanobacterium CP_BM_ER_R8_30]